MTVNCSGQNICVHAASVVKTTFTVDDVSVILNSNRAADDLPDLDVCLFILCAYGYDVYWFFYIFMHMYAVLVPPPFALFMSLNSKFFTKPGFAASPNARPSPRPLETSLFASTSPTAANSAPWLTCSQVN